LEAHKNAAAEHEIPQRVWRQPRDVAIDFHDRPYYGKQPQAEGLWVRGRAGDGTTRFYRVATAYVMLKGLRVALALHFVLPGESTVAVLKNLLKRLKTMGIHVSCLFLDKGFDGSPVIEARTRWKQPALLACALTGKTGGTRALCQGKKSYRTAYTFNANTPAVSTAELAVCRAFTTAKRTKRLKGRVTWLLFTRGVVHLDLTPRQARRVYRRRFGVESCYRCSGQGRGWTTSPNPVYRFLLMALSFILLNVWVHLRWLFTPAPRHGSRWFDTQRLPLGRAIRFIRRALEL
jgi:putative transposase